MTRKQIPTFVHFQLLSGDPEWAQPQNLEEEEKPLPNQEGAEVEAKDDQFSVLGLWEEQWLKGQ